MKQVSFFNQLLIPRQARMLFMALVSVMLFNAASRAQTANFLITPASSQISVGGSFTVNVRVDLTSASCNAAEVHLNFDPAYLRITNITRPFIGTFSSETIALPAAPYTTVNSTGHLEYASGRPSGTTSTDFDILAITFTTPVSNPQTGNTSISMQNIVGHRTRAALSGSPIMGTLTAGAVSICSPPTATIEASSGASICNGSPVGLRLTAATGVGPYSLVVNGNTFNNVSVGPGTFGSIPFPTYKIWPSTGPTGIPTQNDGNSIEVGVKFRASQVGFVKGLRFYSGDVVSGTYKGKLWNYQNSQLLAAADYVAVTQNGWQEIMFTTPVQIAANTTYVATVFSSAGNYVSTDNFFTNGAVTNGPVTALADATSPNGIYFYGTQQTGPITDFGTWSVYMGSNYWVDVIYVPNSQTITLTSVTGSNNCNNTGTLQTINVVSAGCSSLPVTLVNLSASPQGNKIALRWTTSSEINNRGFDVERSTDGANWVTVGFVAGAVNSTSSKSYTFTDINLEPRKYYYRLKQIDIDDRFKYSAIVSATLSGKADFSLGQNYPNPFNNQTTIQFVLPSAEQVNLSLFDVSGRVVKVLVNGSKEAGTHAINLNTGNLTKGVYYYKIQAGNFTDVKKLTIQ